MFQNVSDESISASESASFIIAQMKAFGIEASNAEHIIDAVNAVSNNYAVSSGQLAKTLGNMSAALSVGNNSFEESLGLLTAGTEVTRNASKVSRALVSIQSRLNQVIDESSSTGQALTEWYKKHNIAILDQQGQLRSLYDVLTDVAEIWPELTKNEQAYYLNQQAGANQSQNLAAILSNFDTAAKATATAVNSAGSAMKENESYAESLDFQTNVLKADFQDLANNVIDKQLISALLTLGDAFLKVANTGLGTFITKVGLLAGTGWGLSSLLKVTHIIPVITSQFSNLATVIGMIGNPAVVSSIGGIGTALSAVGGVAGIALPALLGISAAIVGIITLANALEENAHKAEKQLQDLRTQIDEMEDPASEYSNLKSRVDELTESEKIRLGVLQSQLDTLKEQEEVLSRQQLAKWQKGQIEDQTTYVTNYDDYGYGVTEAYTYNQAADSLNNFREAYLDLERTKKSGNMSDETYISNLQALIDKNQTTITNLRDLKTAYEETGDATYKLNEDQEKFLLWVDAAGTKLSDTATKVANAVQTEQDAVDGMGDAANEVESVADSFASYNEIITNYQDSINGVAGASNSFVQSLFDQNGQLTTTAQTALTTDSAMASYANSIIQAQQAQSNANFSNLIQQIALVGQQATITAGQIANMMAMAGVQIGAGGSTELSRNLQRTYETKTGKKVSQDEAAYKQWLQETAYQTGQNQWKRQQEEYAKQLEAIKDYVPSGGGGGSSKKSAEEKAAEEAEKQAKKAQQAQEKAAKQSQQAYESAAKSAEQAAQEAARAAEQAAEEAKQKILDSIQELKDASDDFWDSKTDSIEETNKELDRQKQLEEKLKALEEAKQKKILLYKNGQFQYDKDYGTIAKAQADYEETRDKIQRERELEQLKEMKDNATEIFNEMKDIVQNGGSVTQEMINNWLSQIQADGANYYESNKVILNEWLDWAKDTITDIEKTVLQTARYIRIMGTNGTGPSPFEGSNGIGLVPNTGIGGGTVANDTNGARYLADRNSDNPLYWDKDGDFVGFSKAFWVDKFKEQMTKYRLGYGNIRQNWIGDMPGTSILDDWKKVFEYWATDKDADIYALQDMIDRFDAAKIAFEYYKDVFKSYESPERFEELRKQYEDIDTGELWTMARKMMVAANPTDPSGDRKQIDAWRGTRTEDSAELYQVAMDLLYDFMSLNKTDADTWKNQFTDTALGEFFDTAKREWHINLEDESDRYKYATFDTEALKKALDENEEALKQLSEKKWFEAATDLDRKVIAAEAESRRKFRDLGYAQLGIDTTAQSEAEREANRQASGTMEARQQQKKNAKNIESIEEVLKAVKKGQAISDEYINSAKDYLANAIKENREASDKLYSDTEKAKLDAQNEQMKTISDALTNIQESGVSIKTTDLLEGETTPWDETTLADDLDDWLRDEDFDKEHEKRRAQMLANAEAWWQTEDPEERKMLHEENVRIAEEEGGLTYTGSTGKWSKNATGTRNFRGGISLVGERGPELRVLGQGDNIIPANQTANLWKWSNTTPQQMLTTLSARSGGGNTSYAFNVSRIELPNVTDAKSFVQGLKNYALQYSYKR